MTREEFLLRIDRQARGYELAGKIEEWSHWLGSSIAAICSAIAGLSIVANAGSWNEPYGRVITGALAIVPAVWAALDQVVGLRKLSVFNYGIAQKLRALHDMAQGEQLDPSTQKIIKEYSAIMANEHDSFQTLITGSADLGREKNDAEIAKLHDIADKIRE
ncbi:hypothetical protein [Methylobacterium oryzisoli]|uniref:hypothetical protein n=1 Tax=Methylobacterium oryzisoli TaxID=3385502 RepID=UPI0038914C0C